MNSGDFSIGSAVYPGMSKLVEEVGELSQVLGKLMATAGRAKHWDGTDLRVRLVEELADVRAALNFFEENNLTDAEIHAAEERTEAKFKQFTAWHEKVAR